MLLSTIGVNVNEKTIVKGGKKLKLLIWDTTGQVIYWSINKSYIRRSNIIIFVYDITYKESFESIKNDFYDFVKSDENKNTVLALVGNKSDLKENEQVSEDEARKFADEINAIFMLVSAKTGYNIDSLFNTIVDAYLKSIIIDEQIIQQEIEQKKESESEIKKLKKGEKMMKAKKNLGH